MSYITGVSSIVKEARDEIFFDKAAFLLATSFDDPYFANDLNWAKIFLHYRDATGSQKQVIVLKDSNSRGWFAPSDSARTGNWEIDRIQVFDKQGDFATVERAGMPSPENFTIEIQRIIAPASEVTEVPDGIATSAQYSDVPTGASGTVTINAVTAGVGGNAISIVGENTPAPLLRTPASGDDYEQAFVGGDKFWDDDGLNLYLKYDADGVDESSLPTGLTEYTIGDTTYYKGALEADFNPIFSYRVYKEEPAAAALEETYNPLGNHDSPFGIYETRAVAHVFQAGSSYDLGDVVVKLRNDAGNQPSNYWCDLHDVVPADDFKPTGALLGTSTSINTAGISDSVFEDITFTFTSQPLVSGNWYGVLIRTDGVHPGAPTARCRLGWSTNNTAPSLLAFSIDPLTSDITNKADWSTHATSYPWMELYSAPAVGSIKNINTLVGEWNALNIQNQATVSAGGTELPDNGVVMTLSGGQGGNTISPYSDRDLVAASVLLANETYITDSGTLTGGAGLPLIGEASTNGIIIDLDATAGNHTPLTPGTQYRGTFSIHVDASTGVGTASIQTFINGGLDQQESDLMSALTPGQDYQKSLTFTAGSTNSLRFFLGTAGNGNNLTINDYTIEELVPISVPGDTITLQVGEAQHWEVGFKSKIWSDTDSAFLTADIYEITDITGNIATLDQSIQGDPSGKVVRLRFPSYADSSARQQSKYQYVGDVGY